MYQHSRERGRHLQLSPTGIKIFPMRCTRCGEMGLFVSIAANTRLGLIPRVEPMSERSSFANSAVLEFYKTLPFNIRESVEGSVEAIRQTDPLTAYQVLRRLMRPGLRVLDVGCGAGWFTNSLAYHHNVSATGLDFNPVAIGRARQVAAAMRLPTTFAVGDLFLFSPTEPFDLVVSLGVLHHTNNWQEAVWRLCENLVRRGG